MFNPLLAGACWFCHSGALDELEWKSLARKRLETFEEEIHTGVVISFLFSYLVHSVTLYEYCPFVIGFLNYLQYYEKCKCLST